jgi:hypothetical protein
MRHTRAQALGSAPSSYLVTFKLAMRNLLFHGLAWGMVTAAVASALWIAGQAGASGLQAGSSKGTAPVWHSANGGPRQPMEATDRGAANVPAPQAMSADEARSALRR